MDRTRRPELVRSSGWYFLTIALLLELLGLRYLADFPWPADALARIYTVIAYASHFALLAVVPWSLLVPLLAAGAALLPLAARATGR